MASSVTHILSISPISQLLLKLPGCGCLVSLHAGKEVCLTLENANVMGNLPQRNIFLATQKLLNIGVRELIEFCAGQQANATKADMWAFSHFSQSGKKYIRQCFWQYIRL